MDIAKAVHYVPLALSCIAILVSIYAFKFATTLKERIVFSLNTAACIVLMVIYSDFWTKLTGENLWTQFNILVMLTFMVNAFGKEKINA